MVNGNMVASSIKLNFEYESQRLRDEDDDTADIWNTLGQILSEISEESDDREELINWWFNKVIPGINPFNNVEREIIACRNQDGQIVGFTILRKAAKEREISSFYANVMGIDEDEDTNRTVAEKLLQLSASWLEADRFDIIISYKTYNQCSDAIVSDRAWEQKSETPSWFSNDIYKVRLRYHPED